MKEVEVLLVEDNHGDVVLTREAFDNWKLKNRIVTLSDGEEAIRYLNREEPYTDASLPDLIILDINLPKVDGKQVLQYIKTNDDLQHLPVVIFSSSSFERDIMEVSELKADCYLQKPVDLSSFFEAVRSIQNFWITIVKADNNDVQ